MFCGRQTKARTNYKDERASRAVHNDEVTPFERLLEKDRSGTIHQRNIKILAEESFKTKNHLSNDIMPPMIRKRNRVGYNLRFCKLRVKSIAIVWSENMEYCT